MSFNLETSTTNLETIIGENLKNLKDMNNLKIHANHPRSELTNATKMVSELLNISTMNIISDRIDALKVLKKNKRGALIIEEEIPFTEETVGSLMNKMMAIMEVEIAGSLHPDNLHARKIVVKIEDIKTTPINLGFKRTTKKHLKKTNQLRTVSRIKILNNLCNKVSNQCNRDNHPSY